MTECIVRFLNDLENFLKSVEELRSYLGQLRRKGLNNAAALENMLNDIQHSLLNRAKPQTQILQREMNLIKNSFFDVVDDGQNAEASKIGSAEANSNPKRRSATKPNGVIPQYTSRRKRPYARNGPQSNPPQTNLPQSSPPKCLIDLDESVEVTPRPSKCKSAPPRKQVRLVFMPTQRSYAGM